MAEISWIESAYTKFLYRDLCYIFSGGLYICVFEYILWGEIFLPVGFSLEVIGFLLLSFFLGLGFVGMNTAIISYIEKIFKIYQIEEKYSNILFLDQEIIDKYDTKIINELERMSFLTLIGRTVGISLFANGIFMVGIGFIQFIFKIKYITFEYSAIAILLLLFGVLMVIDYFRWENYNVEHLNDFHEKIAGKKNKDLFEEERIE